jgi:hypothetical protein
MKAVGVITYPAAVIDVPVPVVLAGGEIYGPGARRFAA